MSNLKHHYYNYRYNFKIIIIKEINNKYHYALVGKTKMRNKYSRLDILEFCSDKLIYKKLLLNSIEHLAKKNSCKTIRTQISIFDRDRKFFTQNKFKKRWETNVLVKNLSKRIISFKKYKYFQTEYI